ncbi:hypothetical protein NDU88_011853 [Pleurodeles waltl]|uniref:Uncharacterized protein n=1 Tax=Pleurodeles waltl TaxID=8319 RepID=A0AAV7R181_PLEWA|nr:hypothetical protein NDU88_011853 [Pleurodeles waltl]
MAAQLKGELWTGRSRDPEAGGAPGAPGALCGAGGELCAAPLCFSALAPTRWLRAADLGPGTGNASRFLKGPISYPFRVAILVFSCGERSRSSRKHT